MGNVSIHEHTLANGLKILGEVNTDNHSCGIGFFVRTGSRDETAREAGVSHFLEHMMFKGTSKRSSADLTFDMGNIGAQANAYTSEESTVYYAAVLPEYFGTMQEILSDMLRPTLDRQEFDTEKKVILEEIALYQDRPQFSLFEKALARYFGDHPAGNSVLGTTASISSVERDEMKAYFDRRYSPSNMLLVASGNFDWNSFRDDAERYCASWQNFPAERRLERHRAPAIYEEYFKKNINQAHLVLITEGCSAQEDERFPLAVLSTILGDSGGSKLYWELIDTGIAEGAMVDCDEKDGTGCFMAYASMEPERMDEVAGIVKRVLAEPMNFTDGDLERAKTKLLSRIVLGGELPMGRLMSLGNEWLSRQRIHNLKDVIERLKGVNRAQIENALKKYPLEVWSEFRLLPEK